MTGLGETMAALTRLRRRTAMHPGSLGSGEVLMAETAKFGSNPGTLRLLSHVPDDLPEGAPLVVVLHGCTQRAEAYARDSGWLTLADRLGFAVLAPEQTTANNANRCFNWFEPGDVARGSGEAASIRAMVAHMIRQHGLDPRRVFVTGLSAGGAMTSALLAAYPEVFAAGAIIAGLPCGVAGNVQEAFGAMNGGRRRTSEALGDHVRRGAPTGVAFPRVSIWHGDADGTVSAANALASGRQWASAHGLHDEPDDTDFLPGRTRAIWRSPVSGEVLIESHLIDGLGHGTPLSARGSEGLGATAPFMLEAGVSSSLEIARFWGIAPAPAEGAATIRAPSRRPATEQPSARERTASVGVGVGVGDSVMASLAKHTSADVQGVISKALRAAGLMS